MSDPTKAVFLSYAHEDADAAKRIAEALRGFGVEVWFDQNELVGGDAWDHKIRTQIKECALFIPILSKNAQERREAYFRLEWKLADERTHLMAKGTPFLLPVTIDETNDRDALVPDSFLAVQWTRLRPAERDYGGQARPEDEDPLVAAFCARVKKMLSGTVAGVARPEPVEEVDPGSPGSMSPATSRSVSPRKSHPWLMPVIFGSVAIAIATVWLTRDPAPAPVVAAASTELARVRARIIPDRWQKGDYEAVAPALDRLLRDNPDDADAWALRSIINSLQVLRILDPGTQSLQASKSDAEHALRLARESPLPNLALGMHLVAMVSRGGDPQACREPIDRAVAALPPDALTRFAELVSVWLGYDLAGTERVAAAWLEAEPGASYPAWILTLKSVTKRQPAEAEKWAERAAGDPNVTGVRAMTSLFDSHFYLRGDLAASRAVLERIPPSGRSVSRVVFARWLLTMAEQRWDQALQDLAQVPDALLFDNSYNGPKALLAGMAHQRAGRSDAALVQFSEAERLLKAYLAGDPDNEALRAGLAVTLASAGRLAEARSELALVEPLVRGRAPSTYRGRLVVLIAQTYAVLGDHASLAMWLRKLLAEPSSISVTPASLRFDPRFRDALEAPEIQALLREFAGLDQPLVAAATPTVDAKSVAVLPFVNLSADKQDEYLSDGMTEELLNVLAQVPGLRVPGRSSSFAFKGKTEDNIFRKVGEQLHVATVLEGSVRKAGDKLRITAQLINVTDGFHLWSQTYDRDMKDILAVQTEVAQQVAQALKVKLGVAATRALAKTQNPEAHRLYLLGRYHFGKATQAGWTDAIKAFNQAIELDPNYALAYCGLADNYGFLGGILMPGKEAWTKEKEAAQMAVALDPDLADAHLSLAMALATDYDWPGVDREMKRALELNPNLALAHDQYAWVLTLRGRFDEAAAQSKMAVELDPLSPLLHLNRGYWLYLARRFDEANTHIRKALELDPNYPWALRMLGWSLLWKGDKAGALELMEKAQSLDAEPFSIGSYGHALAVSGDRAKAEQILRDLENLAQQRYVSPDAHVLVYLGLGEKEKALDWLEKSYANRDQQCWPLKVEPFYDPLRTEPRFQALLKKVFPES